MNPQPETASVFSIFKKQLAVFTTAFFLYSQIVAPAMAAVPSLDPLKPSETLQPTQSLNESAPEVAPGNQLPHDNTSIDFLQGGSALQAVTTPETNAGNTTNQNGATQAAEQNQPQTPETKSAFDLVLEQLNNAKNFAAAAIQSVTKKDLITLAKQTIEYGIAVVAGAVVLFTSHETTELSVPQSFKQWIDSSASFLAHFHPEGGGPSDEDRQGAAARGDKVEYVAGYDAASNDLKVYSYDSKSVNPVTQDADYLAAQIAANATEQDNQKLAELNAELKKADGDLVPLRSAPPTVLPGNPVLSTFASTGAAAATITLTQSSTSLFRMDYNVTKANSFAGTVLGFPTVTDLSGISTFVFEMRTGNLCTSSHCVKVEFIDSDGDKASVFVDGLSSVFTEKDILASDLATANPLFNQTAVKQINFVVEKATQNPKNGFMEIKTGGLDYVAPVTAAAYNQAVLTNLTGSPVITSSSASVGGTANGTITVDQNDAANFSFDYTLADNDDFVFSSLGFPNGQDLGVDIVLAAKIPSGKQMRVEVKDSAGKTADFLLKGTGTKKNYTLSLTGDNIPSDFVVTSVKQMVFVADKTHMGASGTVQLEVKGGLDYLPTVNGANYAPAQLVNFPGSPILGTISGTVGGVANGTNTISQPDPKNFSMNYTLADNDDFVLTTLSFQGAQDLGAKLVMAMTIPAGKFLKVEVKDSGNRVADYLLKGTGAKQNYSMLFSAANVPFGFLSDEVVQIVLVADKNRMGASGTVVAEVKGGLDYLPTVPGTPYNQTALTSLPASPIVSATSASAGGTANGTINLSQSSPRDFSFGYTLPDSDDFVFVNMALQTPTNVGSSIVMALTIPNGQQLKVEVKDKNGKVADFLLLGTGSKLNYTLALSGNNIPSNFVTTIASIVLVADKAKMGASGTVVVETKGLEYVPVIPGAAYNNAVLTAFASSPALDNGTSSSAGGTANGSITVNQTDTKNFSFNYTLADSDDFVFTALSAQPEEDLSSGLTMAFSIPAGKKLKVEVKDDAGKVAKFLLVGTGSKQNYTFNFTGDNVPALFHANHIVQFIFVGDLNLMGASGTVVAETIGLQFVPVV